MSSVLVRQSCNNKLILSPQWLNAVKVYFFLSFFLMKEVENFSGAKFEDYNLGRECQKALRTVPYLLS